LHALKPTSIIAATNKARIIEVFFMAIISFKKIGYSHL
jgi:hypothetical protein